MISRYDKYCQTPRVWLTGYDEIRSMTTTNHHFFSLLLLTLLLSAVAGAASSSSNECVYTLYVRTGSLIKAGTDSNISIALGDSNGKSVRIPNLKVWGLMGHKHDYYERGNLDIYSRVEVHVLEHLFAD